MSTAEQTIEICDSYDNTEELLKKFPVLSPTPISDELGRKIQNRLLTGFEKSKPLFVYNTLL